MSKLDLMRDLGDLYRPPPDRAVLTDVPELQLLQIDGQGDPNTSTAYAAEVEALYAVSYGLKFAVKRGAAGIDYKVMPLEGLWWADDMAAFSFGRKGDWRWTMMIVQPQLVTAELVSQAVADAARRKDLPALASIRFARFAEGLSAQIMHLGPYAEEGPKVEKLHSFIAEQDCAPAGKHHEIYLSDPRRTAPERLKTIIRQPVAPLVSG